MEVRNVQIKDFSYKEREQSLKKLPHQVFDLAVVGGGINGAGVARDAASRGMSVILVEANDFASGTSSRSSKLIHGGLRYLENLEFGLVFEALKEKQLLFEIAPHLIHPLRFLIPVYKNSHVGMFKMGLGMWLYDILALFGSGKIHERLSPQSSLERFPTLNPQDLKGSYVYSDAYTDDSRLVLETLRSAHNWGANCLNYMSATGVIKDNGKVIGLKCRDEWKGGDYNIYAKHTVSTVGPWTDHLASQWFDNWQPKLRPSKGIHVTISKKQWPWKEAIVLPVKNSSRIIFVIPRDEMVLIGTTDTDFKGDPSEVVANVEEVSSLLEAVNNYFPKMKFKVEDIISSYAGIRPLVDDTTMLTVNKAPVDRKSAHLANNIYKKATSRISREHVIMEDPQNVTFVMGGKYTTYRRIAEETLEVVLKNFSVSDRVCFHRSRTKQIINPYITVNSWNQSLLEIEKVAKEFNISPLEVRKLTLRHGSETHHLLKRWSPVDSQTHSQSSTMPSLFFEAHHAITQTMCLNLKDFYLRRLPLFLSHKDHGLSFIKDLTTIFIDYFHWDKAEEQNQINQLEKALSTELSWKKEF